MLDKIKFLEMLTSIVEIAKTQENTLTQDEIKSYFNGMELEAEHYDHIYAYLAENQIKVKGFLYTPPKKETNYENEIDENLDNAKIEQNKKQDTKQNKTINEVKNTERPQSKEDSKFLKMYLEDLDCLIRLTDGEEEVFLKQLISGEESVQKPLMEHWLFKVVDIARTYEGKGALLEDLIQEGNMGLITGLQELLGRKDKIDGVEYLKESVEKAMIEYIDELNDGDDWSNAVVAKTNLLSEAARYLAEEFGRVATIKELSEYTKIPVEEIEDILMLSLDAIETGIGDIVMEENIQNQMQKEKTIIDWNKRGSL